MTENELRQAVVDQAKSWLGRKEADESHRTIIDVYNSIEPLPRGYRMTYTDPWCATFVSAVAQVCGLTDIIFPECACEPMIELYKQYGRWQEDDAYVPRPGDLLFYDWQDMGLGDNGGSADHVGLVTGVEGGQIRLIEGNCGGAVCEQLRRIDGLYIRGYGLPDYAGKAEGEDGDSSSAAPPQNDREPEEGFAMTPVPVLRYGDGMIGPDDPWRESVRALQQLLILRGCGVGPDGADGEFGANTERALRRFQRKKGIEETGIANPETWYVLITKGR